jgi:hypothetical protein
MGSPMTTSNNNAPEIIQIEQETMGGHAAHWQLLTDNPAEDVPYWMQIALNEAESPLGLLKAEEDLPEDVWLINGPHSDIQIAQIIKVDENQHPINLISAFPIIKSPYHIQAQIKRISFCGQNSEAILNLKTVDNATIFAFDPLFTINKKSYSQNRIYNIELGGFAYELEKVNPEDTIIVDDPAAIHHHRALNDILAKHDGIAPENLQELITAWQPASEEDKAPVTLSLAKMVAYLYGENFGQEDEAWFQGEILGISSTQFMDKTIQLLDVAIMREQHAKPVVIRLAYLNNQNPPNIFNVGEYIRGNIWIQATIYDINSHN